ncbi:MAG: response regulator [Deltaproteobacteria bacterium]|nr:response regulator [Deltaproteobacteria bacterium]MBW2152549.1 response regulator [Deltaproteobacteria bacterium]
MRGKILIVEDYADWRELLCGMLQREGHEVKTASFFKQAQEIVLSSKDLDVVILDIRLVETDETNEDGMRLLSEIHQSRSATRVIMITGHGTMELQRKAFKTYKAFDFFRKEQFDSEEFRRCVQEAVEEAARDRQQSRDKGYMLGHRYRRWQRENLGN